MYGTSAVNTLEFGTRAPADTAQSTSGSLLGRIIRRSISRQSGGSFASRCPMTAGRFWAKAWKNRSFSLYDPAPGTTWFFRNQERGGSSKIHLNLPLSVALPRLAGPGFPGALTRVQREAQS